MITARPLVEGDLHAALDLLHAYDRRWFGEPVLTLEDVASEWRTPAFDLATDSEGWEDDGRLVAFSTLGTRGDVELAVHEAWAGTGLEEALLRRWETEARRRGWPEVHRELPETDAEGLALLTSRGWSVDRTGWMFRLPAEAQVESRPLPEGYEIRGAGEDDLPAVHGVVRDAFARYGPSRRTYADWRAGLVDRPDVTLDHWRLATWRGDVVGACLVIDPAAAGAPAEAWVPQLAVQAHHRRQGLARELLARTALAARARGVPLLGLYTHEGTGARGLYERFGMLVRHTLLGCTLRL